MTDREPTQIEPIITVEPTVYYVAQRNLVPLVLIAYQVTLPTGHTRFRVQRDE
jgi:hypothetical protein